MYINFSDAVENVLSWRAKIGEWICSLYYLYVIVQKTVIAHFHAHKRLARVCNNLLSDLPSLSSGTL